MSLLVGGDVGEMLGHRAEGGLGGGWVGGEWAVGEGGCERRGVWEEDEEGWV